MKRSEFEMNPGRELDALIAKKVMGLDVQRNKSGSKRGGYYYSIGPVHWHDFSGDMQLANPLPNYSTDIAAAWEVVEKLRASGHGIVISMGTVSSLVTVQDPVGEELGQAYEEDGQMPAAICLAALKAISETWSNK